MRRRRGEALGSGKPLRGFLGAGNHLRLKSWKSAIVKSAVNPRCSYIKGFERQ
jgi:hypothetical protein